MQVSSWRKFSPKHAMVSRTPRSLWALCRGNAPGRAFLGCGICRGRGFAPAPGAGRTGCNVGGICVLPGRCRCKAMGRVSQEALETNRLCETLRSPRTGGGGVGVEQPSVPGKIRSQDSWPKAVRAGKKGASGPKPLPVPSRRPLPGAGCHRRGCRFGCGSSGATRQTRFAERGEDGNEPEARAGAHRVGTRTTVRDQGGRVQLKTSDTGIWFVRGRTRNGCSKSFTAIGSSWASCTRVA